MAFSLLTPLKSFACLPEGEEKKPEIICHKVEGAGGFAHLIEEKYIPESQGSLLFISDVDGVVTDLSDPKCRRRNDVTALNDNHIDSQNNSQSRGDMVPYLKSLIARQLPIIFSSAWPKPEETFSRLAYLDLLNKHETLQEGTLKVIRVQKYAPVSAKELQEAEELNDEAWLSYLKNRPSEETFEDSYRFFQKENCISVEFDSKFFRSKVLSADVFFREVPTFLHINTFIFMEDSKENIRIFLEQLPLTKYYQTLKKVVIFEFPEIFGEIRKEDQISAHYLAGFTKTAIQD